MQEIFDEIHRRSEAAILTREVATRNDPSSVSWEGYRGGSIHAGLGLLGRMTQHLRFQMAAADGHLDQGKDDDDSETWKQA